MTVVILLLRFLYFQIRAVLFTVKSSTHSSVTAADGAEMIV